MKAFAILTGRCWWEVCRARPVMERKDLLGINGKIFIGQGQAIEKCRLRCARARSRKSVQYELSDCDE